MRKQSSPTMKDVAKEAGVALGTVSKVINGLPVSEEYRLKVEVAIKKLNYEVNMYARGLKVQQSNLITLIVPDVRNPFFSTFTHYVESCLYERNCRMVLCCSDLIPEKEIEYFNLASKNQSDGVIALTYSDIGNYITDKLPVVAFDRFFQNDFVPRIASDNLKGGMMATKKLLELGCKRPAFIRFSSKFPGEADKRMEGYLEICRTHHLEPIVLDEKDCEDPDGCLRAFILKQKQPNGSLLFDGVFCNTDHQAYQLWQILSSLHYKVPEDVQIIGFDGIRKFGQPNGELYVSSICQPIKELAATCVELILTKERSMLPSLTLLPVSYETGPTTKDYYLNL